jgi:hypothetical protein
MVQEGTHGFRTGVVRPVQCTVYSVKQDDIFGALVIYTVQQRNIYLIEIKDKNVSLLPVTHNTLFVINVYSGY